MIDLQGRNIEYVRISITDRCNYRCMYCMPTEGVDSLEHSHLLSFEEIERIVRLLTQLGVHAVRITGGEPMVRKGCLDLVEKLHQIRGIDHISMTTNGALLKGKIAQAKEKGLDAVNISVDTLNQDTFHKITRLGDVEDVLASIHEAVDVGIRVKINAVPVRGLNDHDLVQLAELARNLPVDVRFIELMPVGCGANLIPVPMDEVRSSMEAAFGPLKADRKIHGFGPAVYGIPEGFTGSIGFIEALSHEFCHNCNRVRITPEGVLKLCLNHKSGIDLRKMLRDGSSDDSILQAMRDAILHKPVHHGFTEEVDDKDTRRMNQIGG